MKYFKKLKIGSILLYYEILQAWTDPGKVYEDKREFVQSHQDKSIYILKVTVYVHVCVCVHACLSRISVCAF